MTASYHEVPDELLRLGVERLVPGADGDLLGAEEVEHLHLHGPEAPAPVLAVLVGLLRVGELAHQPCLAAVQRHLHSRHLLAAAYVPKTHKIQSGSAHQASTLTPSLFFLPETVSF